MIIDIDKINKYLKIMNVLQSKWILYFQIQKNILNKKLMILNKINKMIFKQFINNYKIQYMH